MFKKTLIATLLASSLAGFAAPAAVAAEIYVQVAPPAPRYEVVPAQRRGYVWVPGYWAWRGHHHVWVRGTWMRERHGYRYVEPRWEERDGRWVMRRGNWARRDDDGDGVPNGVDRRPEDPRRR